MGDPTSSQPEARTSPQPTPLCKAPGWSPAWTLSEMNRQTMLETRLRLTGGLQDKRKWKLGFPRGFQQEKRREGES